MSKNDNIVRVWAGERAWPDVAHWGYEEGEWDWYSSDYLCVGDVFCMNDEDHPPQFQFVKTTSLEGLV